MAIVQKRMAMMIFLARLDIRMYVVEIALKKELKSIKEGRCSQGLRYLTHILYTCLTSASSIAYIPADFEANCHPHLP
jgi:hypothetical protein